MTLLLGSIMLSSAGVCFGVAVSERRALPIVAAFIMLAAMGDLVIFHQMLTVFWAAALLLGALLLGSGLRAGGSRAATCGEFGRPRSVIHRLMMTASALAYVAAAWLTLGHQHVSADPAAPTTSHQHSPTLAPAALDVLAALLACTLIVLTVAALRKREYALTLEGGGMSAMLITMMWPPASGIAG